MSKLTDLRVDVLANDGVEESELTEPVKALRDAGAQVTIVSLAHSSFMPHSASSIREHATAYLLTSNSGSVPLSFTTAASDTFVPRRSNVFSCVSAVSCINPASVMSVVSR